MPHLLSDAEIILLVLVGGFYLFECFYRLSEGTLAFIAADRLAFSAVASRAVFCQPARWHSAFGRLSLVADIFLHVVSCSALIVTRLFLHSQCAGPRGRGMPDCRCVQFAESPKFDGSDREVHVAGERFLLTNSPHEARRIAERLNVIASCARGRARSGNCSATGRAYRCGSGRPAV